MFPLIFATLSINIWPILLAHDLQSVEGGVQNSLASQPRVRDDALRQTLHRHGQRQQGAESLQKKNCTGWIAEPLDASMIPDLNLNVEGFPFFDCVYLLKIFQMIYSYICIYIHTYVHIFTQTVFDSPLKNPLKHDEFHSKFHSVWVERSSKMPGVPIVGTPTHQSSSLARDPWGWRFINS